VVVGRWVDEITVHEYVTHAIVLGFLKALFLRLREKNRYLIVMYT